MDWAFITNDSVMRLRNVEVICTKIIDDVPVIGGGIQVRGGEMRGKMRVGDIERVETKIITRFNDGALGCTIEEQVAIGTFTCA